MIAFVLAAAAATAQPNCTRIQPAPGFAGWSRAGSAGLATDSKAALKLDPATKVRFEPPLTRRPKEGTYGGYFPLTVHKAGRYRVALSEGAWINIVSRGERLNSVAHMPGPSCSGIAKIVAFDLKPGRSWLQLSEAKSPRISVMVSSR